MKKRSDIINKMITTLLAFLITLFSTISGCLQQEATSIDSSQGTIQESIDAAENGATIIVKKGTYNELIVINKTITLIGEDKNTTIINFNPDYAVKNPVPILTINADNCSIENLQITLSNKSASAIGISLNSNSNTIKNNIIRNVRYGIKLTRSVDNSIYDNEIRDNIIGISISQAVHNNIFSNILSNNTQYNIYLQTSSNKNNISLNIMSNSNYALRIQGSQFNDVYNNCVKNNNIGLYPCCGTNLNYFYNNTLINNSARSVTEKSGVHNVWYDNQTGTGNYYDDYTGSDDNHDGIGDTPYEIYGSGNQDIYPLMNPSIDVPCNQ